ncbi:unnamed protein product [Bursaphelenchus xylophilus]|uniref:(pine wood nematode) hypothetical protein n=1 Tax=Bursaphelenchus xylophilus TaxID=6326 RepID=A0A1I7RZF1_BURXY|nr:unnamed protein product [Bursaphelenchus xylophilus]CAG9106492.1 unnamed protein product [Bursaphelenchus xylophilus]
MGGRCTRRASSPSQTQLGDFNLVRSIGKGAFGKVGIVYHRGMKKHYAMKYMCKTRLLHKNVAFNVLRELQILQELSHPFIVNLWFTFIDEDYIYMVNDLLLGGDLRYHLMQCGRFTEARCKLYVCEIALALDYLHTRNIMHRDLKPENILLDDQGHAHLTDFNLATKIGEGMLATSFSGTRPYMAPEILATALGQREGYDVCADWWSLGVCLYEMLRGRRPFEFHSSSSTIQVLSLMINGSITLPAEWPNDLKKFILDLLCPSTRRRTNTLQKFAKHDYMQRIDFDNVLARRVIPSFVPKRTRLNCDPTYELEERICESSPLYGRHRHRRKKNSQTPRDSNDVDALNRTAMSQEEQLDRTFRPYNRFRASAEKENEETKMDQSPLPSTSSPNNRPSQAQLSITSRSTNCSFGGRRLLDLTDSNSPLNFSPASSTCSISNNTSILKSRTVTTGNNKVELDGKLSKISELGT